MSQTGFRSYLTSPEPWAIRGYCDDTKSLKSLSLLMEATACRRLREWAPASPDFKGLMMRPLLSSSFSLKEAVRGQ